MERLWFGSAAAAQHGSRKTPAGGWLSGAHRRERPVRGERDAIDELERLDRTDRENISGL